MHVGLVIGVLSATIERPFFSLAGVDRGAWAYSVQSNLLSMLAVGIAGMPVLAIVWSGGDETLVFGWMGLAVVLSAFSKYLWLNFMNAGESRPIRFRWLLLGSCISAGVIATMQFWMNFFKTNRPKHVVWVQSNFDWLPLVICTVIFALFLISFRFGPKRRRESLNQGFHVVFPVVAGK